MTFELSVGFEYQQFRELLKFQGSLSLTHPRSEESGIQICSYKELAAIANDWNFWSELIDNLL
jgi:hypothetical protein